MMYSGDRLRSALGQFLMFLCPVRDPSWVMRAPHRCSMKSPVVQVHGRKARVKDSAKPVRSNALRAGKIRY